MDIHITVSKKITISADVFFTIITKVIDFIFWVASVVLPKIIAANNRRPWRSGVIGGRNGTTITITFIQVTQMKHNYLLMLAIACSILAGCNFSKGAKKDFRTGLSYNYNGFGVQDVILIDPANKAMTSNKVQLNTQIAISALGVSNYCLKDGKAFPGMMLLVTDEKGKPVINAADLFADGQGYPPERATELRGTITVANPMAAGQTYHVKIHIWDKVTAGNEVNAETDLVVE